MESISLDSSSDEDDDIYLNSVARLKALKKRTETKVKEVVPKETEDKKVDVSEETATLPDDVPLANILSTITNDITPGLTTRSQSRLRANARGTSRDRPRGRRSSRRRGGSSATGHLNESTQDPDSDLEVVSVELPVVQVESLDDSLLKDSDWIDVANKSIDLTDENYEIDIKVLWRSKDIHRVNIQKNGNFANVFTYFAKLEGVTVEEILITKDEKAIKKTDTPASVNLSVIDILEGGIVKKGINPDSSSNNEINKDNRIIKVQTTAKKSLTVTVKKDENFSALFDKCAQDLEIDRSNIKLYFDGETVDENDTPDSLDVEDEACFDLRVTS